MAVPTPFAEVSSETSSAALAELPPKLSMLQTFLSVRGLAPADRKPRRRSVEALKPPNLTAELLSITYTKRHHGQRSVAQRVALREPEDVYIESLDAYVPKKRAPKLLNLHQDEQEVNDAYLTASRALFFERDVLDRVVKLFDVKDKVVVITGGGRGIGKMMADGFVQNGAKVYIASRSLSACEDTAKELNAKGPGQCIALQANLLSEAGCKELAQEIAKRESKIHVLINNSGVSWGGDFDHHPEAAWNKVLTVNVTSPFHLTKFLLPLLDAAANSSDAARIINVGSVAGLMPQQIDTIAYDTSKAAIHHMTRVLAAKLARRPNGGHILVNAIAPGLVPSKMSKGISVVTGLGMDDLATGIPIERVGEDSDMAGLAIFLSSKASGWISGMVIASDGGQVYTMETGVGAAKL
ncbi:hypothetical protein BBJ29_007515 [Phytophthora kernoviae]|uniref:Uncharacterized protein n=1 Tax=Phytophthora kernoviae TaxID=325452 RepID=A0A3F2RIF5_9STRA|nr:hypothetical protein BBJ29_007515 [Phytophthora kernoviae]RLN57774.1 hypothetical protein BBP00_00007354 [Phytophthora kernoviae]